MPSPSRLPGLALAAALLALGCRRDLDLPDRSGPALSSVTPGAAYAGEWLEIAGSGFAADPAANLVQFGSAQARGEGFSNAGGLLLRVPADAGSGPVTVASPRGTSAPIGPFRYLGLGELRARQVSHELALLHRPYRVLAAGGETFLDSDLVVGLVRYGRPDWVASRSESAVGLPDADAVAWYEDRGDEGAWLVRARLSDDHLDELQVPAGQVVHLVPMRSAGAAIDRFAVVRRGDAGAGLASTWTVHDATTLQPVAGPLALPLLPVPHGCDDAGGGRLVCVYHEDLAAPARLALLTPGPSPSTTTLAPPAPLQHGDFDLEEDDPLCVATVGGHRVAAVARADGALLLVDLDAGLATSTVATGSATPAHSLTCPGGPTVLVAKTADDLLVSIDASTGAIAWAAPVARATRLAVEDGLVHVAGDADDVVELRDLATGALRARRSFDAGPGRDDGQGVQALIWTDTGRWFVRLGEVEPVPALLFVTSFPHGLMEVPLEARTSVQSVFPLYLDLGDAIGVIPGCAPAGGVCTGGGYLALRERGLGLFDLAHDVQLGVDAPRDYHAGTAGGLVTVLGTAGHEQVLSAVQDARFKSLGRHPAGGVWAAIDQVDATSGLYDASVRRWSADDAAAGADATDTWTAPGPLDGAAVLGGALWAFYWDGQEDHAVELADDLGELRDVPLGDYLNQVLAVSPNGRTFVSWESQPFSEDTSVVIWSGDPDAGFPRLATVPVRGQVTGAAFDPTGERLHVATQRPGRIVVLE